MKNRIVQLINNEGLTSSKFADTIGVQRSSISHILSGRNKPSLDFIQKIMAAFPSININWLIAGEGEMYGSKGADTLFSEMETDHLTTENQVNQPPKLNREPTPDNSLKTDPMLGMNSFAPGKQIEKVVVFYTDKTFMQYNPS